MIDVCVFAVEILAFFGWVLWCFRCGSWKKRQCGWGTWPKKAGEESGVLQVVVNQPIFFEWQHVSSGKAKDNNSCICDMRWPRGWRELSSQAKGRNLADGSCLNYDADWLLTFSTIMWSYLASGRSHRTWKSWSVINIKNDSVVSTRLPLLCWSKTRRDKAKWKGRTPSRSKLIQRPKLQQLAVARFNILSGSHGRAY